MKVRRREGELAVDSKLKKLIKLKSNSIDKVLALAQKRRKAAQSGAKTNII
jgi:hypothetical protein